MSKEKSSKFVCKWCGAEFGRPPVGEKILVLDRRAHFVPVGNESSPATAAEPVESIKPLDLDSLFSGVPDDKAA